MCPVGSLLLVRSLVDWKLFGVVVVVVVVVVDIVVVVVGNEKVIVWGSLVTSKETLYKSEAR